MNTKPIVFGFVILLCYSNCSNEQPGKTDSIRNDGKLLQAVEQFKKAFKESDLKTLSRMVTQNYQHTNGHSKSIGKGAWFNYLKKRNKEIETGQLEIVNYNMTATEIERFNDMAIITAKIIVESKRADVLQKNEYRVTNIWVIEEGEWKRAGFHDGKIK